MQNALLQPVVCEPKQDDLPVPEQLSLPAQLLNQSPNQELGCWVLPGVGVHHPHNTALQ
jgi:hypothetical protein